MRRLILVFLLLSLLCVPVLAQENTTETETDVVAELDSDTIIKDVNWKASNNDVILTVESRNREKITIVDQVRFEEEEIGVPLQKYTIQGKSTIEANALAKGMGDSGRQSITITTQDTISQLQSMPSFNFDKMFIWYKPAALQAIWIAFFVFYLYRKQMFWFGRAVYEALGGYTIVAEIGEEKNRTYEGYTGSIRKTLRLVYIKGLKTFYNGKMFVISLLVAALLDILLLNQTIYYTFLSTQVAGEVFYLSAFTAPSGWFIGKKIKDYLHEVGGRFVFILDQAEVPDLDDNDEVKEDDELRKTTKLMILHMSEEVYQRFKILNSDKLQRVEYEGRDEDVYLAREIDIQKRTMKGTWHKLYNSAKVLAFRNAILQNNAFLDKYVDKFRKQEALRPLEKESMRDDIYQEQMELVSDIFGEDKSIEDVRGEIQEEVPETPADVGIEVSKEKLRELGIDPSDIDE